MRVAWILNSLAPGGTEQSTLLLARQLRERGVESTFVTLRRAPHDLEAEVIEAGLTVRRLRAGNLVHQIIELRRVLREIRPDIVHTALFDADVVGRLGSWRTGVPVVSSFVNTPYDPARLADPQVSKWKLLLVRLIDALTGHLCVHTFHAVSSGVARANARALRLPMDRIVVAERGRDAKADGASTTDIVAAIRRDIGIPDDQRIVLNVGRQEHQKAQAELLRALPLLDDVGLDVALLVAGRAGNATHSVEAARGELGSRSNRVHLLGHRSDIPQLLAAADVLVISSRFEGTAGVAIEAMALGTPIVSTTVEGVEGVLEHDFNAVLVPSSHPAALARGIARVLTDADLAGRLATRAHDDWRRRFTAEAAAERMLELHRRVIGSPSARGRSTRARRLRS